MEFMRSWITNITVVIIFTMLLDMLVPNNDLKKFAKVIMGLLIILVIIKPFLMIKDMGYQFQATMTQTTALLESAGNDNGESLEAFQNNAALNIFKQKLSDKVIEIVKSRKELENSQVSVNISIENNMNNEDFGSIKAIEVFVETGRKGTVQASAIEPVKINKENVINKKQEEYKWNNSKLSQDLRSDINEVLGLKEADITIEIQE